MTKRYPPVNPRYAKLLHGGDYNPDQWIRTPEIWDQDMVLMKQAGCNAATLGIFAWATLEPEEARFEFGWLDQIMDKLAANRTQVVLATPSGGKPNWMARKYPEICRVNANGDRALQGGRHNHCRQSPMYREKCTIMNTRLAERYKGHPALLLWHVSNEYNLGDCHCELCLEAFRDWLRERYDNDIDKLNHAYWSAFWSHTYPDWSYITPTDGSVHGLMIDWNRFKTQQAIDFFNNEAAPLRKITPDVPITTNFHNTNVDYHAFSKHVDFVSWDAYPFWHEDADMVDTAVSLAFIGDRCRSMKAGKPWILMESVPSIPTRGKIKKRKEPGMNLLSSMQAVAHGSDAVLYFQWRKGRGGLEKFHGAVVDHVGTNQTREFKDVVQVGEALAKLDDVVGTSVQPEIALVHDWENEWALNAGARIYLGPNADYMKDLHAHYRALWESGVAIDVIDQTVDLSPYKVVVMPLGYMLRDGFATGLRAFVDQGGTVVATYWSAVVDESDLCFLGGVPGDGLREVFGVWEEESQSYFPHERVTVAAAAGNALGLTGQFEAMDTCSVIHAEGAQVLATYEDQYFAGTPAVTANTFGQGRAYYIAARLGQNFLAAMYRGLIGDLGLRKTIDIDLPPGVNVQARGDGQSDYLFIMNFNDHEVAVDLGETYPEMLSGESIGPKLTLERYGVRVLRYPAMT